MRPSIDLNQILRKVSATFFHGSDSGLVANEPGTCTWGG